MKNLLLPGLLYLSSGLAAQNCNFQGTVTDEKGSPLPFATVVLLRTADSTMANYGISNPSGAFDIRGVKYGRYILQANYIGYETYQGSLEVPLPGGKTSLGVIALKNKPLKLGEVDITAEHIPILIKKDTVEYNAAAFRTHTDAAAEDLLKKLPGVEVDRSGNIRAQGEDVGQVLVNGQEFFSSDPKVATRNLPAEAVEKVQVYNKKSEESDLTGIADGKYDKTINMILKTGRNSAWFGDAGAGGGTGNHYQGNAKVLRFTRKNQFALLGMANNINKFGFTFSDYLDFNGGLGALMNGGGGLRIMLDNNNSLPLDFGQSVEGLVNSGAAGINYTHAFSKHSRFNISYMGSAAGKKLLQNTYTDNFTPDTSFTQFSQLDQKRYCVNFQTFS